MGSPGWVEHDAENPFVRFRELLWSYAAARDRGWSDSRFVAAVERLDERLAERHGTGFRVTPFRREDQLSALIGFQGELWVKDETGNVAGSHKARHLFGLALWLEVDGVDHADRLAIASCGNAALGAATVAAAAARPVDVFIPTWADPRVVAELSDLGAELHVCERRPGEEGDPCMHRFREAVAAGSRAFGVQATDTPMTLDGGRTLGFEMVADGELPDRIFVQVGGGALASCVGLAYAEAMRRGRIESLPVLHPVQAEGCAPFARAWDLLEPVVGDDIDAALAEARSRPEDFMWPWESEPSSAATGIIDDMTYDWVSLLEQTAHSGGTPIVAPEATILEAQRVARAGTDIPVDTTGSAGLAGLLTWLRADDGGSADRLAVLFTGLDRSTAPDRR